MSSDEATPLFRLKLERADVCQLVREDLVLKSAPLIKCLGDRADDVLKQSIGLKVPNLSLVFREGDPGTSVFFVLRGEIRLTVKSGSDIVDLGVAVPGEVIGENEALLGKGPRRVSAAGRGDAEIAEITRETLLQGGQLPPQLRDYFADLFKRRQAALDEMSEFLGRW